MMPSSKSPRALLLSLCCYLVAITLTTAHPFLYMRGTRYGYGRNIRPLPCVSKGGATGVCMFAWDCMKANGTHLGTCIDRFYFGSCCKMNYGRPPSTGGTTISSSDSVPITIDTSSGEPVATGVPNKTTIKPGFASSVSSSTSSDTSMDESPTKPSDASTSSTQSTFSETSVDNSTTKPSGSSASISPSTSSETPMDDSTIKPSGGSVSVSPSTSSETSVDESTTKPAGGSVSVSPSTSSETSVDESTTKPSGGSASVSPSTSSETSVDNSTTKPSGSSASVSPSTSSETSMDDSTTKPSGGSTSVSLSTSSETLMDDSITKPSDGSASVSSSTSNETSVGDSTTKPSGGSASVSPSTSSESSMNDSTTKPSGGSASVSPSTSSSTSVDDSTTEPSGGSASVSPPTSSSTSVDDSTTKPSGGLAPDAQSTFTETSVDESTIKPSGASTSGTQSTSNETLVNESTLKPFGTSALVTQSTSSETSKNDSTTKPSGGLSPGTQSTFTETSMDDSTIKPSGASTSGTQSTSNETSVDESTIKPFGASALVTQSTSSETSKDELTETSAKPVQPFTDFSIDPATGSVEPAMTTFPTMSSAEDPFLGTNSPIVFPVWPSITESTSTTQVDIFSPLTETTDKPEIIESTEIGDVIGMPIITEITVSSEMPPSTDITLPGTTVELPPVTAEEVTSSTEYPGTDSSYITGSGKPTGTKPDIDPVTPVSPPATDIPDKFEVTGDTQMMVQSIDPVATITIDVESTPTPSPDFVTFTIDTSSDEPIGTGLPNETTIESGFDSTSVSPSAFTGAQVDESTEPPVTPVGTEVPNETATELDFSSASVSPSTSSETPVDEPTAKPVGVTESISPSISSETGVSIVIATTSVETEMTTLPSIPSTEDPFLGTNKPIIFPTGPGNTESTSKPLVDIVGPSTETTTEIIVEITGNPANNEITESPGDNLTAEQELLNRLNTSNYKDICGTPVYPTSRIVGGSEATFGEWPWQVSLRQWRQVTYLHKCGAALLNENWAITAAHCVENAQPNDLLLRLGEFDLERSDEPYPFAERKVQIVATHPQFDARTFEYDLALLRFQEPVRFLPNIIPICIPQDDYNFINDTGYVTGWGRLYEDGPLPSVLQKVPVPVITNEECEAMYRVAGYVEHIPNIFICAGYEAGSRDSCEGDSGGPLVIQRDDGTWYLAGVISWGIGCALPNQPGVYTRISEFREWIEKIIVF